MLPSPKSPQPVTTPDLGVGDLALTGVAPKLANGLDDVAHAEHVRFREESTVGVHGQLSSQLDPAILDEGDPPRRACRSRPPRAAAAPRR